MTDKSLSKKVIRCLSQRRCTVDIKFKDLAYNVLDKKKQPKTILNHVSGEFKHGKLNCIMGPSGAGKSSLLNVLSGFNSICVGDIIVNGEALPASDCRHVMSAVSSYIMQDDHLIDELTLLETLEYAVRFKCPRFEEMTDQERTRMAKKVLKLVGLKECAKRFVNEISGGQRKRLAVAVELVNYPPVLFLDECTTGLDSTSCYRLIKLLKALAKCGCNIITTIHQPNSLVFRMFDHLYVLAPGGVTAYSGNPMSVTKALKSIGVSLSIMDNPADCLFENPQVTFPKLATLWSLLDNSERRQLLSPPDPQEITMRKFPSSIENDTYFAKEMYLLRNEKPMKEHLRLSSGQLVELCGNHQLSPFQQFRFLFRRNVLQAMRDKIFFYGRFAAFLFAAIVIGFFFQGIGLASETAFFNVALLYFCTNAMLAAPALMAVMQAERNFLSYIRENINGWYTPGSYFLARSIWEWILQTSGTTLFLALTWTFTSQHNPSFTFPVALAILISHTICCYHMMFIVSLFLDSYTNFQLPFLLSTIQCLFGGYMIPPNNLPHIFYYISRINFGLYSYIGLVKIVYTPVDGKEFELSCDSENPILCNRFPNGSSVLHANNISPGNGGEEIGIIVAFLVAYLLLGLPAMIKRTNGAKNEIARVTKNDKKANSDLKKIVSKN